MAGRYGAAPNCVYRQISGTSRDGTSTAPSSVRHRTRLEIVGTPDSVAAQMGQATKEVGAHGYLLTHTKLTRRYTAELVDGLVPALQTRGLMRDGHNHATLRENLLEF